MSKGHVNLICTKRPDCRARGQITVVGDALTVTKVNKNYKLEGDELALKNADNYGEHLMHFHTDKCNVTHIFIVHLHYICKYVRLFECIEEHMYYMY